LHHVEAAVIHVILLVDCSIHSALITLGRSLDTVVGLHGRWQVSLLAVRFIPSSTGFFLVGRSDLEAVGV